MVVARQTVGSDRHPYGNRNRPAGRRTVTLKRVRKGYFACSESRLQRHSLRSDLDVVNSQGHLQVLAQAAAQVLQFDLKDRWRLDVRHAVLQTEIGDPGVLPYPRTDLDYLQHRQFFQRVDR